MSDDCRRCRAAEDAERKRKVEIDAILVESYRLSLQIHELQQQRGLLRMRLRELEGRTA